MNKQFEKRLMRAANPRMRKRNEKHPQKFVRAKTHVEALLRDIQAEDVSGVGGIYDPNPHRLVSNGLDAAMAPIMAVHHLAIAAAMDGVAVIKEKLNKKEQMKKLEKRRTYYAAEAARRKARREQVKSATPAPTNPPPTPRQLTDAYLHRRDSEDAQRRFGELMIDLEENNRRAFTITGNKITSTAGGVKDWLKANCPLLAAHYSTCQRYKRLAQEDSDT